MDAASTTSASGRVFLISAIVFVGCAALYLCELQGFRVFDPSMWGIHSKESGIVSPPEAFVFLGGIALGIIAGIVTLVSAFVCIYQHFHHGSNDNTRNA